MKLNIGDEVIVQNGAVELTVHVEDASKGDVIMGKITKISGDEPARQMGHVYEFNRKDIK